MTATVDAHFVGQIGSSALAGISLVFPLIMLMQQMANSSMGGAIASAIDRLLGSSEELAALAAAARARPGRDWADVARDLSAWIKTVKRRS